VSSHRDYEFESNLLLGRAAELRERVDDELRKVESPGRLPDLAGGSLSHVGASRNWGARDYLATGWPRRVIVYVSSITFAVRLILASCVAVIVYQAWDSLGWGWTVAIGLGLLRLPTHVPNSIRERFAKREGT
jgi:hypothetical protein